MKALWELVPGIAEVLQRREYSGSGRAATFRIDEVDDAALVEAVE
jgi:hypothetical protein